MVRQIIHIDEDKCNGCGACAEACHEGAIAIIDNKARLIRDDYCDGMGDCLPECPTGAISFENREAMAYDEKAVEQNKKRKAFFASHKIERTSCPGSQPKLIGRKISDTVSCHPSSEISSLKNWPVQLKLAPVKSDYFDNSKLLVAADCSAFAYGAFHRDFIDGKITLIGCPKLDGVDYSEKLSDIFLMNDIKSITVVRMEVPCCGGLEAAVRNALQRSGKNIPFETVIISAEGTIIKR